MSAPATHVLHTLQRRGFAPYGETAVAVEQAARAHTARHSPVLLLTDAAVYAAQEGGQGWSRLPLDELGSVTVHTDPTVIWTRYVINDRQGSTWFTVTLPLASESFREQMRALAEQAASGQVITASSSAAPTAVTAAALAQLAQRAALISSRSLRRSVRVVSATSVHPISGETGTAQVA